MRFTCIPIILAAAAALGCTDGAVAPTAVAAAGPSFAQSANAPVHIVTGGGIIDFSSLGGGAGPENYGFTARVDGNGVASGQFQAHFSVPDVVFHAEVTCLAVNGNDAWIGMVVTGSNDPSTGMAGGAEGIIRIQDNGANADTPDKIGFWVGPAGSGFSSRCLLMRTGGAFASLFDWTHGNATVR